MEEKKLSLKPFDIQKAKAGKPVCTRDGRKARIICFDRKGDNPITALIIDKGIDNDGKTFETEEVCLYYENGRYSEFQEYSYDLMMLPEKKEGWVNVYHDNEGNIYTDEYVFNTEKDAIAFRPRNENRKATVKIEWEE